MQSKKSKSASIWFAITVVVVAFVLSTQRTGSNTSQLSKPLNITTDEIITLGSNASKIPVTTLESATNSLERLQGTEGRPQNKQRNEGNIRLADFTVRVNHEVDNSFQPLPVSSSQSNEVSGQLDSVSPAAEPMPRGSSAQIENRWQPPEQVQPGRSNDSNPTPPTGDSTSSFAESNQFQPTIAKIAPSARQNVQAADLLDGTSPGVATPSSVGETQDSSVVPTSAVVAVPASPQSSGPSQSTQGTTKYRLAGQPKLGAHYKSETPVIDCNAAQIESLIHDFSPDPIIKDYPYDPYANQSIYQGKSLNANQRPLLELGRPWYQLGQLPEGSSVLGFHNNVNPQFLIFGDYRQAIASNSIGGDSTSQMAIEFNTIWNLFITSTERVVWGIAPYDDGVNNTRWEFDSDQIEFETDYDIDFGYFEGDLGAIVGGFTGKTLPFDAPFAIGLTPILIQNGIWLNDAVEGVFFTVPARNSPKLGISNMDISFGFIWDEINSRAFAGDKNAAKAYMIYSFIEALNGYLEIDYAFLEDRSFDDRSYHNIGLAYSRRFGNFISHSTRVIANAGQEADNQTADGLLLLSENSLITSNPYTVIPYFNMFAGFDMPQSVAGDQQLVNTGILFESDGMTGYPTLDPRANDTFGGAIGLNLLASDFSQQLIMEFAAVFRGDDSDLAGDQYGLGMRYQIPLSNSWIFRTDAMAGFFRGSDDANGIRMEFRKKF